MGLVYRYLKSRIERPIDKSCCVPSPILIPSDINIYHKLHMCRDCHLWPVSVFILGYDCPNTIPFRNIFTGNKGDRMNTTHQTYETLDPENWDKMRALAHRMVDDAITYLETV